MTHPDVKGGKKSMLERNKEISPEVQKMTEGMIERWQRAGVKFDSQAVNNPEVEKQAQRIIDFTNLINPRRRLNK
jgi:hypothetical protein